MAWTVIVAVVAMMGMGVIVRAYVVYLRTLLSLGQPRGRFGWTVVGRVPRGRTGGGASMLEVSASMAEKFRFRVRPLTNTDPPRPAEIEAGSLKVTSVEASGSAINAVAEVENADTATVQADRGPDAVDTDVITVDFLVEGDADLGAGVKTIQELVRLTVPIEQAGTLKLEPVGAVPRSQQTQ